MKEFKPHPALRNRHLMTIAAHLWRRRFPHLPAGESRLFTTEPGTQILAACHWQPERYGCGTIVLLHGLEGSIDSGYIVGAAERAWIAGFNVVRVNQRNCGGSEHLTPTLYHSGLSGDIRAVLLELIEKDKLTEFCAVGFSMGGNLVLKMAGEFGEDTPPEIKAYVAVAPAMNLATCVDALDERQNFLYQRYFVDRLKARISRKARHFPQIYQMDGKLETINTVRDYDDILTAPYCGFHDADDYYARCSAAQWLHKIARPTLVIAAEDDPFVPFMPIARATEGRNPLIELLATKNGGHCAFISATRADRFWSEACAVDYFLGIRAKARPSPAEMEAHL